MALSGVYARLLYRGPGLRVFRSWSSATAQTGQYWTWDGMGKEKLEARGLFRGDFSRPMFAEKGEKTQSRSAKRKDPWLRVRLRPSSNCPLVQLSVCPRWVLSQNVRATQAGRQGRGQGQRP